MVGILKEYEQTYLVIAERWPSISDKEADTIVKFKMGIRRQTEFPNNKGISEFVNKFAHKVNSL